MHRAIKSEQSSFLDHSRSQFEEMEFTIPKYHRTVQNNHSYKHETEKSANMGSQIPSKTASDAIGSKPRLAIMRNFILREGKDQDIARQPKVLTEFQRKNINENQSIRNMNKFSYQRVENPKQISKSKSLNKYEFLSDKKMNLRKNDQKQDFYRYCTEEIVRVTNKNTELEKKIQQISNRLQYEEKVSHSLKEQNQRVKNELQEVKNISRKRQVEIDHLRSRIADEERLKLQKIKMEVERIGENRKAEEQDITKYLKIIGEKDQQNNKLVEVIRNTKLQNLNFLNVGDQNAKLNRRIAELIRRNQELEKKVAIKSQTMDHLWKVKEIQYGNIMGLIKQADQLQ